MNVHKNARLTPSGRLRMVRRAEGGEAPAGVAHGAGISLRTLRKWIQRYRHEGAAGLEDRRSRPHRIRRQLPRYQRRQILRARRRRWSSLRIAQHYGIALSTVVTIQRRLGLNRLTRLEPPQPVMRYEKRCPGELVHLDVKRLGKIGRIGHRIHGDWRKRSSGVGWERVHVAIDDCTRLGYAEVLPDEQGPTTAGFLERASAWFAALGIHVRAIMTDNGPAYLGHAVQHVLRAARLQHQRTRPYRPQTNGKAERFIRTLLTEWVYARPYRTSTFRAHALSPYLRFYNTERRHTALNFHTPLQRLAQRSVNNVFINNT
ncbi:MAG: IS481 family transposase [Gemmatimonadaceae bacterium]